MNKEDSIYVAGSTGLVGSAICRKLKSHGYKDIITFKKSQFDLRCEDEVDLLFKGYAPKYVFNAAAVVGGILVNDHDKIRFLQDNLAIQTNLIKKAHAYNAEKYLFLGSTCIYPRDAPVPTKEFALLTGPLEKTNEAYALAKITGVKQCEYYWQQGGFKTISLMPTNLYGPNDNFNVFSGHAIPSLIAKFSQNLHTVNCWGDGTPEREFMHVDDLADACIFVMNSPHVKFGELYNVGTGKTHSIRNVAELIKKYTGSVSEIRWDYLMPNGAPRRLLDSTKINALGWSPSIKFENGLKKTVDWYRRNYDTARR